MKLIDLNISIKVDNNDKVIKFLKENESDIITLQEVMRGIAPTVYDRYNNSRIIKEELGQYSNSFFGPVWVADRHMKNGIVTKDFGGLAEQGNEIISKYPILEANNMFYHKNYAEFIDVTNFRQTDHGRALEQVILQINEKKLQILNVHGIWNIEKKGDARTLAQCAFILEKAMEKELPTIIVGDFNLHPETESINLINQKFTNLIKQYDITSTRPTVKDGLDVGNSVDDYIFVNSKIKVKEFRVIQTDISDHYPLLLDFEITE